MAATILAAIATLQMVLFSEHQKPILFIKEWLFLSLGLGFFLFHNSQRHGKTNS